MVGQKLLMPSALPFAQLEKVGHALLEVGLINVYLGEYSGSDRGRDGQGGPLKSNGYHFASFGHEGGSYFFSALGINLEVQLVVNSYGFQWKNVR